YGEEGKEEITLPQGKRGREAELEELCQAVFNDKPVFHDGHWGMATLEVCLAILQSSEEGREIPLSHQIPSPY
ncbi:MAG: gfo/Idh/MocA family oxidoreductase, partial [Candidatus Binatia bacterium]